MALNEDWELYVPGYMNALDDEWVSQQQITQKQIPQQQIPQTTYADWDDAVGEALMSDVILTPGRKRRDGWDGMTPEIQSSYNHAYQRAVDSGKHLKDGKRLCRTQTILACKMSIDKCTLAAVLHAQHQQK